MRARRSDTLTVVGLLAGVAVLVGAAILVGETRSDDQASTVRPVRSAVTGSDPADVAGSTGAPTGSERGGVHGDVAHHGDVAMHQSPSVVASPETATFVDGVFSDTFDGAPGSPTPWNPPSWDVTVHSRDVSTWDELEPMDAHHGAGCEPPGTPQELVTHRTSSYDDAVFLCRDHVMTAINAGGYGVIYLTPAAMVDFSEGTGVVRFDVSTLRTSGRDWWDIWVSPFDQHVQLPLQDWLPDLNGHPLDGINVRMDFGSNRFIVSVFVDGVEHQLDSFRTYDEVLTPDPAKRETFELRLSGTSLSFGLPAHDLWWFTDEPIPQLSWDAGVVQLGHHSYNPEKDCTSPCAPNTWHWDNVQIQPAIPFTMVNGDVRAVGSDLGDLVVLSAPAPAGAHLRFAGIGTDLEVSFDGGATWELAQTQAHSVDFVEDHFRSYWTPIPVGVTEVRFRGDDWWGGPWRARDISVWALKESS
jgi:hypothetical protein